ncbi:DUF3558 family protein [Streptomyces sp. NPDC017993]|uniref:DUF3558 family protein n=1 Tax=Streptomyces sp. NPDC017993 TaxID=3365027 RepID=UPI0037A357F7
MLIVAIAVVLLSAAAGGGIWQLASDGSNDSSDPMGGFPGTMPSGAPSATEPLSTTSAVPGSALDPCTAVDTAMARQWGLGGGRPESVGNGESPMRICTWGLYGSGTTASGTFRLIYAKDMPVSPEPTPISVAGVPSAKASGNDNGCVVQWPTSFGQALVHAARVSDGAGGDLCRLAADFASAVAIRVPS